ncbi:uncharacterized protein LOC110446108 [Mizuhopecten yessoensis]|uniref:Uncharacterized protein n=1 Tax=Mizuhopecten yessoensis TaxID=6573 RepID=A0A210QY35_MIZYE|nr:uncharacterized protein LOC110446108 [Mizuhopecten yessoensis]OWF53668.1 hypothetical protein KP79_PYT24478 [Mizuhopecten yessoensis]
MTSRSKLSLQVGWAITFLFCLSFATSAQLPNANIQVLNKLIREKLLMKVIPELQTSWDAIQTLQLSSQNCKGRITTYQACADCTNNNCINRYTECKIGSKKRLGLCDIVGFDQKDICALTVNSEKFMLNVVTNIKDRLSANLRYAMYDMGSSIQQFIVLLGNYVNSWSSSTAFKLQNGIKQIQTRYTIENDRLMADISYISPEEVILRDMSSAMNIGMEKLGASIPNRGSFSYDLSRTLADLLSVHFHLGRKKRAVACNALSTGLASCLSFRDKCQACRSSPKSKPITAACGAAYVSKAKRMVNSLTRTVQIYEEVLSRVGFVQSAFYNRPSFNTQEIKYPNTRFTVGIQSKSTPIVSDFHVFAMQTTAEQLANTIWSEWIKMNPV